MATTPTLASPGIGSGLDVNGIVQKLMTVEQQPLTDLAHQESADQAKITAYGSLKSSLAALQTTLQNLSTASSFNVLKATSSDASALSATVSGKAVAGSYGVTVSQLAQAQKLASSGFATTADHVGTGTLTFDFGTFDGTSFTPNGNGAKTVTIAAGQDTLAGIRDAVNAANIGVTATIVNDGSANGNRLVFTAAASGAANSIRITAADDDGNATDAAGLSQLAFDPAAGAGAGRNLTQQVAAQDALLTIDGIAVKSPTNTISNALDGVTLNLLKTSASPVTLSVAPSVTDVAAKIAAFVKAYNDLNTTFTNLTKYDATKKQASVLTGDGSVRMVQNQLRTILGGSLASGTYSTLSQVGVTFQADGTLALDDAKLQNALTTSSSAVMQLFASAGSASDGLVSVNGFTSKTIPGTYNVDVTQLATQGTLVGSAPSALTITAGVNDALTVTVDGTSAALTLAAGTYADANALAAELQSKINGAAVLAQAGTTVKASTAGGVITVTSNRYGSASSVTAAGSAIATLFGATSSTAGVDVAGTLSGRAMTGSGQVLLGAVGSDLEGLRVQVSGGAIGARGSITYSTGFASRLNDLVSNVIGVDGAIAARTDGLQKEITDIGKRRDALNAHLALVEANYRAQFNALDTMLANLQAQSTALAQQLASLPKITTSLNSKD